MNSSLLFILSVQLRNMVTPHQFHGTASDMFSNELTKQTFRIGIVLITC
jgi:hypothetical protein